MVGEKSIIEYKTVNGFDLILKPIANIYLFKNQNDYPKIQIPKAFIASKQVWVENPFDPRLEEAQIIVEAERTLDTFSNLVRLCAELKNKELLTEAYWKRRYKYLLMENEFLKDVPEETCFIKYVVLVSDLDQYNIAEHCCLTENKVFEYFNSFTITRNGTNVHDVEVKNAINTGIDLNAVAIAGLQLVNPLDEYDAAIASNLSWIEWIRNQLTNDEKAATIALYRLNRLKNLHIEDEQQIQQEKKGKHG